MSRRFIVFGVLFAVLQCTFGTVFEGRVFLDANKNGIYDDGEAGMANVVVSDSDNVVKTDANGWFKLESRAKKPLLWIMRPSQHEPTTPFWMHGREGVVHEFGLAPSPQKKDFLFFQITDSHINKSSLMKETVAQINSLPLDDVAFVVHTGDHVKGSDTQTIEPIGPPPLICMVMEPLSTFCILPIMEVAVRARPKAAVALGVVL